ncbi:MAG: nucleotidyltransferase domain-containing protein [Planctomycetes bacterium]|nr:nucleotidyltransferase domain-containing protein [Planctomycetota bacterium]
MMVLLSDDALNEITKRLVAEIAPERIFMFGSRAYGKPEPDSDLDLMIIVDTERSRQRDLRRRARSALGDIGCGVDILVRTPGEFEHRASWPSNLEATIKSKGRLLYG